MNERERQDWKDCMTMARANGFGWLDAVFLCDKYVAIQSGANVLGELIALLKKILRDY